VEQRGVPKPDILKTFNENSDDCLETWDQCFNSRPHSNRTSRTLIPEALEALYNHDGEEWVHHSDLHPAVTAWFEGQKEVIFFRHELRGIEDLFATLRNYKDQALKWLKEEINDENPQLMWILRELMHASECWWFHLAFDWLRLQRLGRLYSR
jgi:hypothetical protein